MTYALTSPWVGLAQAHALPSHPHNSFPRTRHMKVNAPDQLAIEHIVGQLHASTTDTVIEAQIRRRVSPSAGTSPAYADALVAYAIETHARNVGDYVAVRSGRL